MREIEMADLTSSCSIELSPSFQLGMMARMAVVVDHGGAAPAERERGVRVGRTVATEPAVSQNARLND
jgi:hypothetical protein